MHEQEERPKHNPEPISESEKEAIWEGITNLYDDLAYLPEYPLPEAPTNLVSRFQLARNEVGDVDPAWHDLPDDLFYRALYGRNCALTIASWVATHMDEDLRAADTPVEAVRALYWQTREETHRIEETFDLHDVYVCTQAMYVQAYEQWQDSGGWYEYTELPTFHAALDVIGQTISQEQGE